MKYIKYFESVNIDSEIEDNMNDYMLPLRDKGFDILIYVHINIMGCEVGKSKNRRAIRFKFSEIKEEIYGLINFIKEKYNIDIDYIHIGNDSVKGIEVMDDLSSVKDSDVIYDVSLYFKKD